MTETPATVPVDQLREWLDYDPGTGLFKWRVVAGRSHTWNAHNAGRQAGGLTANGYILIRLQNRQAMAHRIAWAMVYGAWPTLSIDHINRVRNDNRIANLREVSRTKNSWNSARRIDNTSGFTGVGFHKQRQKWRARIINNGREQHLGFFDSEIAAAAAYAQAAQQARGEFARMESV